MTDYKALLEWLTLPLRPRLRAERKEKRRIRLERHAERVRKEFKKLGIDFLADPPTVFGQPVKLKRKGKKK